MRIYCTMRSSYVQNNMLTNTPLFLQFSEEYNQLFEKSGMPPKRKLTKFIVTPDAAIPPGNLYHITLQIASPTSRCTGFK